MANKAPRMFGDQTPPDTNAEMKRILWMSGVLVVLLVIFVVNLPTVQGLGQFGGFDMWLQDRSGAGYEQLTQARNILLGKAAQKPEALVGVRPNGLENAPQLQLHVDRVQAQSMGMSVAQLPGGEVAQGSDCVGYNRFAAKKAASS